MIDIDNIRKKLHKKLPTNRYNHTIGVAYTAAALAMRYDIDIEKALIAGLLHDCAKEYKTNELIEKCNKDGIVLSSSELNSPQIVHAIYGIYMARNKYDITDEDILSSIRWHTTGKADMSLLEKIVFTADYIEPGRCEAKNLDIVRHLAFEDLTKAVYIISRDTIAYLKEKGLSVDEHTVECFEWIKGNCDCADLS